MIFLETMLSNLSKRSGVKFSLHMLRIPLTIRLDRILLLCIEEVEVQTTKTSGLGPYLKAREA